MKIRVHLVLLQSPSVNLGSAPAASKPAKCKSVQAAKERKEGKKERKKRKKERKKRKKERKKD